MKNTGYIKEAIISRDQYILGGLTKLPEIIINPSGNWETPETESQINNHIDTFNCTGEGSTNQIETYLLRTTGKLFNFSERAVGIISGTYPPGNTPQNVYEAIRRKGLIPDDTLPFLEHIASYNAYYEPNPLTETLTQRGLLWLDRYEFMHEWVETDRDSILKALQFSPLGVSVYAWYFDGQMYVRPQRAEDNHWTCLVGTYENGDWKIFDSYSPFIKRLSKDFTFGSAKRIYIKEKVPEVHKCWLTKLLDRVKI